MSKTSHTPGPWAVNPKAATSVEAGRRGVAACGGYFDNTSDGAYAVENEANARLIAAAPDLYAALDGLLAAYSDPDQQICCNGHECGCRGASVRDLAEHHARAALAKARGETK